MSLPAMTLLFLIKSKLSIHFFVKSINFVSLSVRKGLDLRSLGVMFGISKDGANNLFWKIGLKLFHIGLQIPKCWRLGLNEEELNNIYKRLLPKDAFFQRISEYFADPSPPNGEEERTPILLAIDSTKLVIG